MPSKIHYRLYDPGDCQPMQGDFLMSQKGRAGYLILGAQNRGRRRGLGAPVYDQLLLTVERVPRNECLQNKDRLWTIKWERRRRRTTKRPEV